jgi:hypothetical protein
MFLPGGEQCCYCTVDLTNEDMVLMAGHPCCVVLSVKVLNEGVWKNRLLLNVRETLSLRNG